MEQFMVKRSLGLYDVEVALTLEEQEDFVGKVKAYTMKELLEKSIKGKNLGMGEIVLSDEYALIGLFDAMMEELVSDGTLLQGMARKINLIR